MDPGYAGAYSIVAVQIIDDVIHVIDEVYERGLVTEEMIQLCQSKPWWQDVQFGVIDVAGYQHHKQWQPRQNCG